MAGADEFKGFSLTGSPAWFGPPTTNVTPSADAGSWAFGGAPTADPNTNGRRSKRWRQASVTITVRFQNSVFERRLFLKEKVMKKLNALDDSGSIIPLATRSLVSMYPLSDIPDSAYEIYPGDLLFARLPTKDERAHIPNPGGASHVNGFSSFSGMELVMPANYHVGHTFANPNRPGDMSLQLFRNGAPILDDGEQIAAIRAIFRLNYKDIQLIGASLARFSLKSNRQAGPGVEAHIAGALSLFNFSNEPLFVGDRVYPRLPTWETMREAFNPLCRFPGRPPDDLRATLVRATEEDAFLGIGESIAAFLYGGRVMTIPPNLNPRRPDDVSEPLAWLKGERASLQQLHKRPLSQELLEQVLETDQEILGAGLLQFCEALAKRTAAGIIARAVAAGDLNLVAGRPSISEIVETHTCENIPGGTMEINRIRADVVDMFGGMGGIEDGDLSARWFASTVCSAERRMRPPVVGTVISGGAVGDTMVVLFHK